MSRQQTSPMSSRANSVNSSSRASRMRALSTKSGATMMTTDSVEIETDLFRENYFKSQNQIEQYKKIRDQAQSDLRRAQVAYEFQKRQLQDIESNLNIRESILREREAPLLKDEIRDLKNFQYEQRMAEQRREYKINQIEEAKLKIENIYREISKTLDDTIKNTTIRNDIPLLTTENKGLIAAIEKKTIHVKEIEEVKAKHEKEMNALKEKEAELNNNKAKMDEQYNNIESRRIEAIRILADPIDSTEYEEKAVSDLEQDAQNTENRYEAIRKSDERDDTAKILAQIEKLEQQNIKRKMIISQKKVVLDNQKKFRERRVLEDQKRIQQQKEAIEKLKNQFAEAEKARAERATKEAEEDVREEHSLPVKKYIPAGKIRDANDLIEQVKLFEQKNQEHLDKIVSEISQMEQKFKNTRAADQEKWKRMMRRVDTYTKRITKKDGMLLSISEMNEKNEELTEKLKTLIQSKDQMKRRKHLNLTRKEEYPDDGPSYDTISAQLKEKQIQLDQRKEILEDRSKELEHRKIEVDSIEKTVNEKQRKVLLIEAEVAKYKDVMSNAVDDLNNNQVSLDNTISTLETTL